ncbi:MAG TPA: imidazole glycerol phosphate synthase subunit HisH [Kofleriaceae bacterium]|jgi:glutamine amidotransferase|nr:imidazole glycerol phosphate synthase subunit HisH [Kofleriaceae bacterium]
MIAVVDVCSGNLRSVEKALAAVGGQVTVTRDPEVVRKADKVVVPGQGAFGAFVRGLAARGLEAPLREQIARGTPYLGICLGLQVLFDQSEEQGPVRGLGVVAGTVERFRPTDHALKVPHMGWNQVDKATDDPLLAGVPDHAHVYFVHSYRVVPADPRVTVLTTDYGGRFCAAIRQGNVFACQFHPEKSQQVGLALLARFVQS